MAGFFSDILPVMARPAALTRRQVTGRAFAEAVTLIRTTGTRDATGRWAETETETEIRAATYPPDRRDPRIRELTEGGVQLNALRRFFTAEEVRAAANDTSGDIIVYGGERWRVRLTAPWGRYFDSIAVRQEDQPIG